MQQHHHHSKLNKKKYPELLSELNKQSYKQITAPDNRGSTTLLIHWEKWKSITKIKILTVQNNTLYLHHKVAASNKRVELLAIHKKVNKTSINKRAIKLLKMIISTLKSLMLWVRSLQDPQRRRISYQIKISSREWYKWKSNLSVKLKSIV